MEKIYKSPKGSIHFRRVYNTVQYSTGPENVSEWLKTEIESGVRFNTVAETVTANSETDERRGLHEHKENRIHKEGMEAGARPPPLLS